MSSPELEMGPIRNATYYFDNSFVIFDVKGILYRVPRYHFTNNSPWFKKRFERIDSTHSMEGLSDDTPFILSDVTTEAFKAFLKFVYPTTLPPEEPTIEEWLSITQLSSQWKFAGLHTHALAKLGQLLNKDAYAARNIKFGRYFKEEEWVFRGLDALLRRKQGPNDEEIEVIGTKTALTIHRLRDENYVKLGLMRLNDAEYSAVSLRASEIKCAFPDDFPYVKPEPPTPQMDAIAAYLKAMQQRRGGGGRLRPR